MAAIVLLGAGCNSPGTAAEPAGEMAGEPVRVAPDSSRPAEPAESPPADPPAAERTADDAPARRVVVSLERRRLWLLEGGDTLLDVPAGIGKGTTLEYGDRVWTFDTPVGRRTVLGKQTEPVWVPPDWHFVEVARENGLELHWLREDEPVPLSNGGWMTVRGGRAGMLFPDGTFEPAPLGEEIVFGGVLYAPPLGSVNRRVPGELGTHKLDLGDGYLIHGSRDESTVGEPVSHGCIRLRNADVRALFEQVEVGTEVEVRTR